MVKAPTHMRSDSSADPTADLNDRRKHLRVKLPLKARFLDKANKEQACLVFDISAGGVRLRAKTPPSIGDHIVLYIDELGRFEGRVVRSRGNSFAVNYEKKRERNARTADDLTEVVNRGRRMRDRRAGGARVRHDAPAEVHFEDGRMERCTILDISLTGASIEISPRPPLGTHLVLGRMTAKVVRRHETGVGVVFTGAAKKMTDVVEKTSIVETAPTQDGAGVAPAFGKKGLGA